MQNSSDISKDAIQESVKLTPTQLEARLSLLEEKNRYYKKLINDLRSKQREEVIQNEFHNTSVYKWGLKIFKSLRPFPEKDSVT